MFWLVSMKCKGTAETPFTQSLTISLTREYISGPRDAAHSADHPSPPSQADHLAKTTLLVEKPSHVRFTPPPRRVDWLTMHSLRLFCIGSSIASAWSAVLLVSMDSQQGRPPTLGGGDSRPEPHEPAILFHLILDRNVLPRYLVPFSFHIL